MKTKLFCFLIVLITIIPLFILLPTAQAKILNKELVDKAILTVGYQASICPVEIGITGTDLINRPPEKKLVLPGSPAVTKQEDIFFKDQMAFKCLGDEESIVLGQVELELKNGSEKWNEHLILYKGDLLRQDSTSFTYYQDGSLGGNFKQNPSKEALTGLQYVKSTTLHLTSPDLPDGQERVEDSGVTIFYRPDGGIGGALFVYKGQVYKLVRIEQEKRDIVLVDYTEEDSNSTPLMNSTSFDDWKTYTDEKNGFSIKYPDHFKLITNSVGIVYLSDMELSPNGFPADREVLAQGRGTQNGGVSPVYKGFWLNVEPPFYDYAAFDPADKRWTSLTINSENAYQTKNTFYNNGYQGVGITTVIFRGRWDWFAVNATFQTGREDYIVLYDEILSTLELLK